ncbi:MAG TPA: hypothetical protein VGM77_11465 [Gemmatimonadales bacterium]|jgi:hypothetical protein
MPRQVTDLAGEVWNVMPSGRRTQYGADETSLEFRKAADASAPPRFVRYSPRGAKSVEIALEDVSDAALLQLLAVTQPSWTAPEQAYGKNQSP